jgi:hypothetical protein
MGRVIGSTDIVRTSDTDRIYYAQPLKAVVYSRFARNRRPQPSNILTVVLMQDPDGSYQALDTWMSTKQPTAKHIGKHMP